MATSSSDTTSRPPREFSFALCGIALRANRLSSFAATSDLADISKEDFFLRCRWHGLKRVVLYRRGYDGARRFVAVATRRQGVSAMRTLFAILTVGAVLTAGSMGYAGAQGGPKVGATTINGFSTDQYHVYFGVGRMAQVRVHS